MKPLELASENALPILRAFKTIAVANGQIDSRQRSFVETHQKEIGDVSDIEALATITPQELADCVSHPDQRKAIVQRMVIVALLDEEADPQEISLLQSFAKTLDVDEPAIAQMKLAANRSAGRLALDMLRHGFLARVYHNARSKVGLRGIMRDSLGMYGWKNENVARKFGALRELSEDTLGGHYIAYMKANSFPLPGEAKGAPQMLIFHDIGHALTGFTTDVPGEMRMAGFEAGYMKDDGFGVLALGIFGFHMGLPLPNIAACRGGFDWHAVTEGYRLGQRLMVDLRDWDPWPYMDRPLAAVRTDLGMGD